MRTLSLCVYAVLLVLIHGMDDLFTQDATRNGKKSAKMEDYFIQDVIKNAGRRTRDNLFNRDAIQQDNPRDLESGDDYINYLVDKNGNEYEPYSLAWRYLGMYIDCDFEDNEEEYEGEYDGDPERFLEGDDGDDCDRVLLWAAYVDPRYKGGSIGEYQFYDILTDSWDKSTCQTRRCARMDCHEPGTHFKLVGVFKETDGAYDWAEQLFKHEGYCVWGGDNEESHDEEGGEHEDVYEFMSGRLESWPEECIQLYLPDYYGNTLYLNVLPQGEGNITMGVFSDESCTKVSTTTTWSDYIVMYYSNYYGSDYGQEQAEKWEGYMESWNKYMNTFKICQPCRAYSHTVNVNDDEHDRFLENENDGEGDEEQWGYNCYDDAGYTNVNQVRRMFVTFLTG